MEMDLKQRLISIIYTHFILSNRGLMKSQQKQAKGRDEVILMEIQAPEQYIALKIIANLEGIDHLISVCRTDVQEKYFKQLEFELEYASLGQEVTERISQKLNDASIRTHKVNQLHNAKYWSLKEFDQIVFGGAKFTLLRSDYLIYVDGMENLTENLFPGNSGLTVQAISEYNLRADDNSLFKSHFLIKNANYLAPQPYFPFPDQTSLVRMGSLTLNFTSFLYYLEFKYKDLNYKQLYVRLLGEFQQLLLSYEQAEATVFLKFQYRPSIFVQYTFMQSQQIENFLKKLFDTGYSEFIEWSFHGKTNQVIAINELYKFTRQVSERMKDINSFRTSVQINQWSKHLSNLETYQLPLQANYASETVSQQLEVVTRRLIEKSLVQNKKNWASFSNIFDQYLSNWTMTKHGIPDKTFTQLIKALYFKIQRFKLTPVLQNESNRRDRPEQATQQFALLQLYLPKIQVYLQEFMKRMNMDKKDLQKWLLKQKERKEERERYQKQYKKGGHFTREGDIYQRQNVMDHFFFNFIEEFQSVKNGKGQILITISGFEKKPLKEFLSDLLIVQREMYQWDDVFNIVTMNIKQVIKAFDEQKITSKQYVKFQEDIQYEDLPTNRCLGCTQFFYLNSNIERGNTDIQIIPHASKIKDYESSIKQAICEMLNDNGGIILFNCMKEYGSIVPNGALLTEKDKEGYENQINNLLNSIYPKPQASKNIFVSFVPVAKHPLALKERRNLVSYTGVDQQIKKNQSYYEIKFIEGLYCMRIKVCPTDASRVYIWSSEDSIYHLSVLNKKQELRRQVQHNQIKGLGRVIKAKFKAHQRVSKQLYRPVTFGNPLVHECTNPMPGIKIKEKEEMGIRISNNVSLQDSYNHVSMLVVKNRYLPIVHQKLTLKGIQCQIEVKFQEYKFKTASNTAILYHNQRFEEVLHKVSNRTEFEFEGKHLLVVSVTNYLRLEDYNENTQVDYEELLNASLWLKREFPSEDLQCYELRKGRTKEYYLRTGSKISTLFMYYLLNGFRRRAVFKNPPNLDRMTPEEQRANFIKIDYQLRGSVRKAGDRRQSSEALVGVGVTFPHSSVKKN